MTTGGTDIIIKGSSIDISFTDSLYPDRGNGSHKGQRKMQRIIVVDDQQQVKYDSRSDDVKKWTVTVLTGNE
jgi:hypothetical protein